MKKWLLVLTMPSGGMWVLAEREGSLALFPAERGKENVLRGVMGFDTEKDAWHWINETAKLSEQGAKLMERVQPMLGQELQ